VVAEGEEERSRPELEQLPVPLQEPKPEWHSTQRGLPQEPQNQRAKLRMALSRQN
jgi:hypothetical protein